MTKFEAKICVFLKVDFAFVGVVLHDTMKKTILGLSQEKRFMAGKSYLYVLEFFDDCFNKNDFCG